VDNVGLSVGGFGLKIRLSAARQGDGRTSADSSPTVERTGAWRHFNSLRFASFIELRRLAAAVLRAKRNFAMLACSFGVDWVET
jgi:hypothetical protein